MPATEPLSLAQAVDCETRRILLSYVSKLLMLDSESQATTIIVWSMLTVCSFVCSVPFCGQYLLATQDTKLTKKALEP